jgi:hypothetical protein
MARKGIPSNGPQSEAGYACRCQPLHNHRRATEIRCRTFDPSIVSPSVGCSTVPFEGNAGCQST